MGSRAPPRAAPATASPAAEPRTTWRARPARSFAKSSVGAQWLACARGTDEGETAVVIGSARRADTRDTGLLGSALVTAAATGGWCEGAVRVRLEHGAIVVCQQRPERPDAGAQGCPVDIAQRQNRERGV